MCAWALVQCCVFLSDPSVTFPFHFSYPLPGSGLPDMLQVALCLSDCREAGTLSGHNPRPAGAAGRQEQWGRCSARYLYPVATDKPGPECSWLWLPEVTMRTGTRVIGMLSTSSLLCRETSLALPRSERAGLDPPCHLGQRPGLSHKCQASLRWNSACLEMASLPTSE